MWWEILLVYLAPGLVVLLGFILLLQIKRNTETIMSSTPPGLTALEAAVAALQAEVEQNSTDIAALVTAVNAAIAIMENSEDTAVQAQAGLLQTAVSALTTNEASLQAETAALTGAETPAAAAAKKD